VLHRERGRPLSKQNAPHLLPSRRKDKDTTQYGGNAQHIYQHAIKGFSAEMTEDAAIALSREPQVEYVEEDSEVSIATTQNAAPWGLDRIDQRDRPLNATYRYSNASTGAGVHVYVIDS
jgi:hypothetical protein